MERILTLKKDAHVNEFLNDKPQVEA